MKNTVTCMRNYVKRKLDSERIENHYYSMGNNVKSYGARWMDGLIGTILVFAASGILMISIFDNLYLVLVLSSIMTFCYYTVRKKLVKKRVIKGKELLMREETLKKFNDKVLDMNKKDFFILVKDLIENSGNITELNIDIDSSGELIVMEGNFGENRVGIYCRKVEKEQKIKLQQLKEFVNFCMNRGLEEGIYVTNGYFDQSSKEYVSTIEGFMLYLADMDSIYNVFLKKGQFFSREAIEKQLEEDILDHKETMEYKMRKLLTYKKIKAYMVLGLLLAVYSRYVNFKLYYIFVSIILLCFAVTAAIRWHIEKYKSYMEKGLKLDQYL